MLTSVGVCYQALHEQDADRSGEVRLDVPRGFSPDQLVEAIHRLGWTAPSWTIRWGIRSHQLFESLEAGSYTFPASASVEEVLAILKAGPNALSLRRLTIRPGESIYEVAREVASIKLATEDAFLARASHYPLSMALSQGLLGDRRPPRADGDAWLYLEGLLAADTYHLRADSTLEEVIDMASATFWKRWSRLRSERSAAAVSMQSALGLGDYELLILASLVQKEMAVGGEAPRIAGVFYNRLQQGMRLKTDPTAMYRHDRVGEVPRPKHTRDRTNPYNTYAYVGLPPGPICAPGPEALQAVFGPEKHAYLFFVARRDGTGRHDFSVDAKAHMAKVRKYLRSGRKSRKDRAP